MKILGINAVYHESSAAIVVNGEVLATAEEERFNRFKHGSVARTDNPDELPVQSIDYCLAEAGLKAHDLDVVVYSFDPKMREENFFVDPHASGNDWGTEAGEAIFMQGLSRVQSALEEVLEMDLQGKFVFVPHHLAHAASTFYPSGYEEAGILVVDGIGEYSSTLLAQGKGNKIEVLSTLTFPDSLGFLWEKFSKFLGFAEYDACKIMGLAGYGDASIFSEAFEEMIQITPEGFTVNGDILRFREEGFEAMESLLGPKRSPSALDIQQRYKDIAASLQELTNQIMLHLSRLVHEKSGSQNLCIAGGVGLNCTTNWHLKESGPFDSLFIPSAPHDAGTAYGAALYHYFHTLDHPLPVAAPGESYPGPNKVLGHPYTGPGVQEDSIAELVSKYDLIGQQIDDPAKIAARMIADGNIIGWFQGRMEVGPRALGNRSLLADPRNREIREIMNYKVKHREPFRPFAPSVLEEKAAEWLELGRPSESYRYMLYACPVRPEKCAQIPAVIHVDKTARVQLVSEEVAPMYHRLITEFDRLTGVPIVLNTSFNDSEPIVCTPEDAIKTFMKTRIDALFLGNFLILRTENLSLEQVGKVRSATSLPQA